jgi:ketosteroid isomerase-like protein
MYMKETAGIASEIELLHRVYAAFNQREIETILAMMHREVDWPNGWKGGRVHGTAAVRDYWTRQFKALNPRVEPTGFAREADGRIEVTVHQVVHDVEGNLVVDTIIRHVYDIREGMIRSMEIRD